MYDFKVFMSNILKAQVFLYNNNVTKILLKIKWLLVKMLK